MILNLKFILILFFVTHFNAQNIDFTHCQANLNLNFQEKKVSGKVEYICQINKVGDSIKIDAVNMNINQLQINGINSKFINNKKQIILFENFKKGKNTISFFYEAIPKQTLYFVGSGEKEQIWTQGQGKYTSHWLPSFNDVNEKLIFNISVAYNQDFTVISNGKLNPIITRTNKNNQKIWFYEMQKPMSSYLVMLSIGKYFKKNQITKQKTPLEFYLLEDNKEKFDYTYKYSKEIFDYLEQKIGYPYPWEIYKQVPAQDFLYAGMENTSATIFAQDFVVDKIGFNDKNYLNVNAHELAHQWFGNLITAQSGEHHWLQEGFATYFAVLSDKNILGEDYFYFKMYENANKIMQSEKTDTIPVMNAKASSLSFYQKGAWALFELNEKIGNEKFDLAIKNYLKKYAFKNVTTQNFLDEIKKVTNFNTKDFENKWLKSNKFPKEDALLILSKNEKIKEYLKILELYNQPFERKKDILLQKLQTNQQEEILEEVLFQIEKEKWEDKKAFLDIVFESKNIKLRQQIAIQLDTIPIEYKIKYESLLNDESYITKEISLKNLWNNFPLERVKYLELTKNLIGFNDKNIRILWLSLALKTEKYQEKEKINYYNELLNYSNLPFESSVRQNAIASLLHLNINDTNALKSLVAATVHHKWQFTLFARNQIRSLLESPKHLEYFKNLLKEIPENQKYQLERLILKEK